MITFLNQLGKNLELLYWKVFGSTDGTWEDVEAIKFWGPSVTNRIGPDWGLAFIWLSTLNLFMIPVETSQRQVEAHNP